MRFTRNVLTDVQFAILKWMKRNLERFERVYTSGLLFADFIERALSMNTVLRDTLQYNLRILRLRQHRFAIDIATSTRWQTAQTIISVFVSLFYPTSILSVPLRHWRATQMHPRKARSHLATRRVTNPWESAFFGSGRARRPRGGKKEGKMKMREKYRARGDSCANTWWEFALIFREACSLHAKT